MARTISLACLHALLLLACCNVYAEADARPPEGFIPLFNGIDLAGWTHTQEDEQSVWRVDHGQLIASDDGSSLTTLGSYDDFQLAIEWHAGENAKAYLALNGTQTKIELPTTRKGADTWNHVILCKVGRYLSITHKGKVIASHEVSDPPHLPLSSPIELQTTGGEVRFRNIFIRSLDDVSSNALLAEKSEENDSFVPLFNGQDFSGWMGSLSRHEVVDQAILSKTGPNGYLVTKKQYADYVLRFEFKLTPGANNGIGIRMPDAVNDPARTSLELQILDDTHPGYRHLKDHQFHGSAYNVKAARRGYLRPVGEWNYQQITVIGSHVNVELNGHEILDIDFKQAAPNHRYTKRSLGHIGICSHGSVVAFRSIEIREIQPEDQKDPLASEQHALAFQVRAALQRWRGGDDTRSRRPLVITLFTGKDTNPAPDYRARLTRTMKHIQSFYASEMLRNGYGPMTFPLTMAEDGLLDIHVVEGDKPNAEYSGKDGKAIREIVLDHLKTKGIDGSKETVLIFCNLTKWDPAERRISHHSPYYAGGSHQAGTAWQLDSVLLDVGQIGNINKEQYVHDGQYGHISLGRYQSIFVGGICHELGHALGLPHNKERTEEKQRWGTALMGSGNFTYSQESRDGGKGSFLTFAHATKLASHPAFSGSMKQMRANPQTAYHELSMDITNNGTDVRIKGKVTGKIPVYAVIAYLDPEGGSDYNATSHAAVTDNDGRFTIDCTSFAGKQGRIRLVAIHANGWSRFSEDVGVNYTRDIHGKIGLDESALNSRKMDFGDIDTTGDVAACTHCKRK